MTTPLLLPESKYVPQEIYGDVQLLRYSKNIASHPPFVCPYNASRRVFVRCAARTMQEANAALPLVLQVYMYTLRFMGDVGVNVNDKLYITCICHPAKRKFPTDSRRWGEALGARHVNGGLTWRVGGETCVFVYRTEEMVKVLMHELIHAIYVTKTLSTMETEAVVEALACEVYTRYMEDVKGCVGARRAMTRHIRDQSARVRWYLENVNSKEESNVYAYYVIKATLYCDGILMGRLVAALRKRDDGLLQGVVREAMRRKGSASTPPVCGGSLRMTPCFEEPYH